MVTNILDRAACSSGLYQTHVDAATSLSVTGLLP
jgi:hypothetical protein